MEQKKSATQLLEFEARLKEDFRATKAYIQYQKPTKVMTLLNWNSRNYHKRAPKMMSDMKNRKISSHGYQLL